MDPAESKVYEIWPSKNVFYCKGYIICGPKSGQWVTQIVAGIIAVLILFHFCGVSIYFLFEIDHSDPDLDPGTKHNDSLGLTFTIIAMICQFNVVWSFISVTCTDPGILPRKAPTNDKIMLIKYNINIYQSIPGDKAKQMNKKAYKYCYTCRMYRPKNLLTHHCSACDNCIIYFDHHCHFLGTCIGYRNHRSFVIFLTSCALALSFMFVSSIAKIFSIVLNHANNMNNDDDSFEKSWKYYFGNAWEYFDIQPFFWTLACVLGGMTFCVLCMAV